jgi:hypothetical protein
MSPPRACPVCHTPEPADGADEYDQPWLCCMACFGAHWHIPQPQPETPSCHDAITITCPVCQRHFTPTGRQKYCSDACRAAAYRRRRDANRPTVNLPKSQPRRPITVYECDGCGLRSLGEQYCPDCSSFMSKIGLGGECPHCAEPVAISELIAPEVINID